MWARSTVTTGMGTAAATGPRVPIKTSRYWVHPPSVKQAAFLALPHEEALFGGAAGGGKSDALLMAALQYVDVPGYAALILRRTSKMLKQPDALIPRSLEWLAGTDAVWSGQSDKWTFPSGATLTFGYLDHEKDLDNYQGAAYQFVGWDELTQFDERHYRYVSFSRQRRPKESWVPVRVRAASNPGGRGHNWVKQRFLTEGREHGRVFVPSRAEDNPGLDVDDYVARLQHLDHHTRRQLLEGDWDAREPGDLFRRDWFETVDGAPANCRWVRFWDLAATEPSVANPDPDWTVGLKLGRARNGEWYVADVQRLRARPDGVRRRIQATAKADGRDVTIILEQEPGSSGKTVVDDYVRGHLADYNVRGRKSTGSKFSRAVPVSSKAEHGLVKLVAGPWITAFLDELEAFGEDEKLYAHDDQVDALSGAFEALARPVPQIGPVGVTGQSSWRR